MKLPVRSDCRLCDIEQKPIYPGIPIERDPKSRRPARHVPAIVFIGGAPSSDEDRFGRPWVGPAGQILRDVYVDGIYAREKATVYYANLIRCRTGLGDPPPSATQISNCSPYLDADLSVIGKAHRDAPKILCILGSHAAKHFFDETITACAKRRIGRTFPYAGHDWYAVPTFNPAILLTRNDPNTAASIEGHLQIALQILNDTHTSPASVEVSDWGAAFEDGYTLSLDLETYGSCWRNAHGRRLPKQTVFNANRMVYQDRVRPEDVALSASLTEVRHDPLRRPEEIDLRKCEVGTTKTYHLHDPAQRMAYIAAVRRARILIGQNLPFDIGVHRRFLSPSLGPHSHFLIELQALNYLDCEVRLERDLKSLSYILGNHHYDEDEGKFDHQRFSDPFRPNKYGKTLLEYNAEDTHVTAANVISLADRIFDRYPDTAKLNPECLAKFSALVWDCIAMAEVGVGYSHARLRDLEEHLRRRITRCELVASGKHDLSLSGKGSDGSKKSFVDRIIDRIDGLRPEEAPSILSDPRLERTKKTKAISFNQANRNLFTLELPTSDPLLHPLALCRKHNRAQKVLGSFVYPLLYHQKTQPRNKKGLGLPLKKGWHRPLSPEQLAKTLTNRNKREKKPGKKKVEAKDPTVLSAFDPRSEPPPTDTLLTYPTWYPVPSADEGDPDAGGGTQQGRITCKNHSVQTDPPELQRCMASRHKRGLITGVDLSQIELRTGGLISGEPSIISAYQGRRDLHWERAELLFDLPTEYGPNYRKNRECKGLRRQPAKTVNFGDLFLAMAKTLQLQVLGMTGLYVPIEVFQLGVDQRPEVRPVLCEWQARMISEAIRVGHLELPITGQSRMFIGNADVVEETYASTIVNFPIQTTAANFLLEIVREMRQDLPDWSNPRAWVHVICNKYDAVYFDLRSPVFIDDIKEIWHNAFIRVVTRGYWARLQDHYGNEVPVEYEWAA